MTCHCFLCFFCFFFCGGGGGVEGGREAGGLTKNISRVCFFRVPILIFIKTRYLWQILHCSFSSKGQEQPSLELSECFWSQAAVLAHKAVSVCQSLLNIVKLCCTFTKGSCISDKGKLFRA